MTRYWVYIIRYSCVIGKLDDTRFHSYIAPIKFRAVGLGTPKKQMRRRKRKASGYLIQSIKSREAMMNILLPISVEDQRRFGEFKRRRAETCFLPSLEVV